MISPPCSSLPSFAPQLIVWRGERVKTLHEAINRQPHQHN
jgi:hypothetical protein